MKRTYDQLDSKQILDVIETYSVALALPDNYDHQSITIPEVAKMQLSVPAAGTRQRYILSLSPLPEFPAFSSAF